MAFDEAMLQECQQLARPVLRFYSWSEGAASFGYSQRYREVAATTALRPLIRRCTGGGLVPHDGDWTYSLAFPPAHERYRLRAEDGYRLLHLAVARAFCELGVEARLAAACDVCGSGQCFVGHERHDVVGPEGKLAGAAQRRTRTGLLIQGSVRPPNGLQRAAWEDAFRCGLGMRFQDLPERAPELAPLRSLAEQLAREKYSRRSFLERR